MMKLQHGTTTIFALIFLPFLRCQAQTEYNGLDDIVQLHGSGTSNPSRCLWHVLEEMESESKISTRLTYRATATGNGIADFIGNISHPNNDFASGDIPMTADQYQLLKNNSIDVLHLPILLGAVGVFHSVPVKLGHSLNMTGCLLSKIFRGSITDWWNAEIASINPNLDIPLQVDSYGSVKDEQSYPIYVSRRLLGSSSTFVLTSYLHKTCPSEWPEDLVGGQIDWPGETQICEGTTVMANCILDQEGAIGYLDVGTAHDKGLSEAALRVESVSFRNDDFYLDSLNSISKGGLLPALTEDSAKIPNSTEADWSAVDVVNNVESYVYTWPMIIMTFVYVRKDLTSFIPDPRAQSLLVTFLKNLYDDAYMEICESKFQFTRIGGDLRDMALEGISTLVTSPDAPEWITETDVVLDAGIGQGDYVLSNRRQRSTAVEQEVLARTVEEAEAEILELSNQLAQLQSELGKMNASIGSIQEEGIFLEVEESFGDKELNRLNVSFVLSILALSLWLVTTIILCSLRAKLSSLPSK